MPKPVKKPPARSAKTRSAARRTATKALPVVDGVTVLAGGNPQIAKGDGDAPVAAYLAAIPDRWKQDIARRIDALVVEHVKGVKKAVKWNTPFYGVDGVTWFLSFHMFDKYVKVTWFKGASLTPLPRGTSKHPDVRYTDIRDGELDEKQLVAWVKQAAALPGEKL